MRILLVDDHPVFRAGMVVMLRGLFAGAQIAEAGDVAGLRREIAKGEPPDLVLLDILFPGFDALKEFPALRKTLPLTPILAVSMVNDNALIANIMAAGANGFISKTVRPDAMSQALLSVMEGETVVLRASGPIAELPEADALSNLTARQLDVLRLLAQGLPNKDIARQLDISPFTVRIHVSAVLRALGLPNRSAVASFAASHGLL